ncbi:MAG: hypothetical protein IT350_15765 [Deltaproteobacteria bacterium]|nr:hypothetical protein [Deltaproteobacteria bacterium]
MPRRRVLWICVIVFALASTAFVSACASMPRKEAETRNVAAEQDYRGGLDLTTSLFASDKAVISGEDIAAILGSTITLPESARISVVKFQQRPEYGYWSEEMAALDRQWTERFLTALKTAPRVSDARMMPSMLVPRDMSIPLLREAAARFQSELLLIYRSANWTYTSQKKFAADESRSYCAVEAVVLHVRTGVVVWSGVFTEDYLTRTTSSDANSYETVRRAEHAAFEKAMMRLAGDVTAFLQQP